MGEDKLFKPEVVVCKILYSNLYYLYSFPPLVKGLKKERRQTESIWKKSFYDYLSPGKFSPPYCCLFLTMETHVWQYRPLRNLFLVLYISNCYKSNGSACAKKTESKVDFRMGKLKADIVSYREIDTALSSHNKKKKKHVYILADLPSAPWIYQCIID